MSRMTGPEWSTGPLQNSLTYSISLLLPHLTRVFFSNRGLDLFSGFPRDGGPFISQPVTTGVVGSSHGASGADSLYDPRRGQWPLLPRN